ncbi:trypsin-like serine protease [Thaumasiovibrio sp. DFM-14]|uniref:trypsin-like serine protease n=1 Tax=Thaumasiovibrio sp. DFM-14 TaxID=3384792 RepID=UPI0039A11C45
MIKKWFWVLWLMVVSPLFAAQPQQKIVGGIDSGQNELPWQLFLQVTASNGVFNCGAVYIGNRYALTAAHCVENAASDNVLLFGGDVERPSQLSDANAIRANYTIHPLYDGALLLYDIAVLELATEPAGVKPILLATLEEQQQADRQFETDYNPAGESAANLVVSGWGLMEGSDIVSSSRLLQQTMLTGVPDAPCRNLLEDALGPIPSGIDDIVICALTPQPDVVKDSCSGDSGGPLVWQDPNRVADDDFGIRLLGLVSFGFYDSSMNICTAKLPGGYTEVAGMAEFIADNTSGLPTSTVFTRDPFQRDYDDADGGMVSGIPSGGGTLSWFWVLALSLLGWRKRV